MGCCSQECGTEPKAISVMRTMGWMDWAGWWVCGLETELTVKNRSAQVCYNT